MNVGNHWKPHLPCVFPGTAVATTAIDTANEVTANASAGALQRTLRCLLGQHIQGA